MLILCFFLRGSQPCPARPLPALAPARLLRTAASCPSSLVGTRPGEEGGGCPERPETPTRLQGSLLGEVGALLLPCSRLAETKPRLAQHQEEGSLGAQAGPERRLSGSFLSQGVRGTVTW